MYTFEVNAMLYEIKVQLRYINPPIYRVLHVPSNTNLFKFKNIQRDRVRMGQSTLNGCERYVKLGAQTPRYGIAC